MYNEHFEKVEKVLETFPIECRKNYYKNKKSLKIRKNSSIVAYGDYDHEKNKINLCDERALSHELFHMAFRDKRKIKKRLCRGGSLVYSNGIAYKDIKTNKLGGVGLTEGFTEYLSRKCSNFKGQHFLYFFTDLLISIYGEDIIEYPLKNDILGFIDDKRFFEIIKISSNMDELLEYLRIIKHLNINNENLNIIFERCTKEEMIELSKKLLELKSSFRNTILELFNQIIEEYNNCDNPKILKKDLVNKLNEFVTSTDYNIISYMVFENGTISEQVQTIISEFSNEKIMTK